MHEASTLYPAQGLSSTRFIGLGRKPGVFCRRNLLSTPANKARSDSCLSTKN